MGCPPSKLHPRRNSKKGKSGPDGKKRDRGGGGGGDKEDFNQKRSKQEEEEEPLVTDLITQQIVDKYQESEKPGGPKPTILGAGEYGAVFKINLDGKDYALKVIHEDEHVEEIFNKELAALKEFQPGCSENHIVCYVGSQERQKPGTNKHDYFIVTDFLKDYFPISKDNTRAIKSVLTEEKLRNFISSVVSALKVFEDHGWSHNDLHMRNVLIHKQTAQPAVIDLGLTRKEGDKYFSSFNLKLPKDMTPRASALNDRIRARLIRDTMMTYYFAGDIGRRVDFMKTLPEFVKNYLSEDAFTVREIPLVPFPTVNPMMISILKTGMYDTGYRTFKRHILNEHLSLLNTPEKKVAGQYVLLRHFLSLEELLGHLVLDRLKRGIVEISGLRTKYPELTAFFALLPTIPRNADEQKRILDELQDRNQRVMDRQHKLLNLEPADPKWDFNFLEEVKPLVWNQQLEDKTYPVVATRLNQAHVTALLVLNRDHQYRASMMVWPSTAEPNMLAVDCIQLSVWQIIQDTNATILETIVSTAVEYAARNGFKGLYLDNPPVFIRPTLNQCGFEELDLKTHIIYLCDKVKTSLESVRDKLRQSRISAAPVPDRLDFKWPWEGHTDRELAEVFTHYFPEEVMNIATEDLLAVIVKRHSFRYRILPTFYDIPLKKIKEHGGFQDVFDISVLDAYLSDG